jgi:hypothetical protein
MIRARTAWSVSVHVSVCVRLCVRLCVRACMHLCVCVCVCVCMCMCVCAQRTRGVGQCKGATSLITVIGLVTYGRCSHRGGNWPCIIDPRRRRAMETVANSQQAD